MPAINENSTLQGLSKAERYQFNMLARHQTIERLQKDIFTADTCSLDCTLWKRLNPSIIPGLSLALSLEWRG